jgi:copper homeostasis protein
MNRILLEISSFSYNGCIKAKEGGADRIELCSSPTEAGTTPSYGLVKLVKEKIDIQVYPIIRPRGGNFIYTDEEFQIMLNDILLFKSLGCNGIALGVQKTDGKVDTEKLKKLVDKATPMKVTYIRAFDLVPDVFQALDDLIVCGCERVLTSGQVPYAIDSLPLIKKMTDYAGNRISIMPGSGIRADNVETVLKETGVKEIHTSARQIVENSISTETTKLEFGYGITCDLEQIKSIRQIIDKSLNQNLY